MTKAVVLRGLRALKYVAVTAVAVSLFVVLGIAFRINLANKWEAYSPITPLHVDDLGRRILIFTTHPDDETLACGGLIALAKESGAHVRVVAITNGDAYRVAAARSYRTVKVTPQMCIKFALERQQEMLRALQLLGMDGESITFLGYPDRGIAKLWQTNWDAGEPLTSMATKRDYVFYADSPSYGKPYCGQSLLDDISRIIGEEKPTDVFFAHPRDNHSDHYATSCFVMSALVQLEGRNGVGGIKPRMWEFVVHRGDWPYYSGQKTHDVLAPPFSLSREGEHWYSLNLGSRIAEVKKQAILTYKSQMAMEPGFMLGFARANEVFAQTEDEYLTDENKAMTIDGVPDDWYGVVPAVINPVNDTLMADLSRAGDVRVGYLLRHDGKIYARFDTAGRLSKRITYTVQLRFLRGDDNLGDISLRFNKLRSTNPNGATWAYRSHCMEMELPTPDLKRGDTVWLRISSKMSRLPIDDTGWQSLEVR